MISRKGFRVSHPEFFQDNSNLLQGVLDPKYLLDEVSHLLCGPMLSLPEEFPEMLRLFWTDLGGSPPGKPGDKSLISLLIPSLLPEISYHSSNAHSFTCDLDAVSLISEFNKIKPLEHPRVPLKRLDPRIQSFE